MIWAIQSFQSFPGKVCKISRVFRQTYLVRGQKAMWAGVLYLVSAVAPDFCVLVPKSWVIFGKVAVPCPVYSHSG